MKLRKVGTGLLVVVVLAGAVGLLMLDTSDTDLMEVWRGPALGVLGIAILYWTYEEAVDGQAVIWRKRAVREDHPTLFWIMIAIHGSAGFALCFLAAWLLI